MGRCGHVCPQERGRQNCNSNKKNMKKIILLALTALIMVGCYPENAKRIDDVYYSITVDSCEYIYCKGRLRGHKGNCRFCQERRQKELKELVEQLKEK